MRNFSDYAKRSLARRYRRLDAVLKCFVEQALELARVGLGNQASHFPITLQHHPSGLIAHL
jgi:hypothetical protein